ncbi:hypothetical protein H0X06_01135 [Candidatus Dependentiae bacterium]|nr:hypothetical protein [Candidatus Dependentiae bacterium]
MMKKCMLIGFLCVPVTVIRANTLRNEATMLIAIEQMDKEQILQLLPLQDSSDMKSKERFLAAVKKSVKNHTNSMTTGGRNFFNFLSGLTVTGVGAVASLYAFSTLYSRFEDGESLFVERNKYTNRVDIETVGCVTIGSFITSVGVYLTTQSWKKFGALKRLNKNAKEIQNALTHIFIASEGNASNNETSVLSDTSRVGNAHSEVGHE